MSNKVSKYWYYGIDTALNYILEDRTFKEGDLVMTLMGDYGIIISEGAPKDLEKVLINDPSRYYKILIEDEICHYLSHSLKKVKKT